MKLLRYLEEISLCKLTKVKQPNGSYINDYKLVSKYKVQKQSLSDQVSATIYGANITKMFKISTPLLSLEHYLLPKVDNKEDNISLYAIKLNDNMYRIRSVLDSGIEIERI